jgi:hypothetical protein
MDLNRLNPTQYMWIITKTNKPLCGFVKSYDLIQTVTVTNWNCHFLLVWMKFDTMKVPWLCNTSLYRNLGLRGICMS